MTFHVCQEVMMKHHARAARAHFAFAACYAIPLAMLLVAIHLFGKGIDWRVPAGMAGLLVAHLLIGWGAWRAHNWARVLTLALAFPALLAVPLGTLVAILLISCCWPAWESRRAPAFPAGVQ
jgi:hypothetical protein